MNTIKYNIPFKYVTKLNLMIVYIIYCIYYCLKVASIVHLFCYFLDTQVGFASDSVIVRLDGMYVFCMLFVDVYATV